MAKNLKIYSLLVYHVHFILYCSALTLLTVGTISAYSVMQMSNESLRRKKGEGKTYSCIFSDEEPLEQELKRWGKKEII